VPQLSTESSQRRVSPPVKIQGGKTRLIPFLREHLDFDSTVQRWVEPFLGAGGVLLNLMPERALVGDSNPYIIGLYRGLQSGALPLAGVVADLRADSELLRRHGAAHFYEVRERFNVFGSPVDFLFLNHTCFNGLVRFNRKGEFNSPFGHDKERLTPSLIDDIASRLRYVQDASRTRGWTFKHQDWRNTLAEVGDGDFVYADPPYAGRHATYYNGWRESEAGELASALKALPCAWALSDWAADAEGPNPRHEQLYPGHVVRTCEHSYVIGAAARSRGRMTEALVLSRNASPSH
jgi:DNA adenine methylase